MRWTLLIAAAPSICVSVLAQAPPVPGPNSAVILRSTSTMVTVPALARTPTGEFVNHLHASDFELYDNGVQQSVKLENTDRDPIALLVLLQTGASASGHFADYTDLPTLLDWLLGANDHEIMLVTFDSRLR